VVQLGSADNRKTIRRAARCRGERIGKYRIQTR
jgi:hypothetical protein